PGAAYNGSTLKSPRVFTGSFVSTLSSTLLNEFRVGLSKGVTEFPAAWDDPRTGREAMAALPSVNGIPYIVYPSFFFANNFDPNGASRGAKNPFWLYGDTLSW